MGQPRPTQKTDPRREDEARLDELAGEILGFLADDAERLQRFMDATGVAPQDLRAAVQEPGFATGLLDYLCADERLLLGFAADRRHEPARLDALRQRLGGSGVEPDG